MATSRVAVIGLDCAAPQLVFGQWLDELPTFRALIEDGLWGKLRSVDPPITVPAWSCMTSGKDPGQLGVYGFRNRRDHSYGGLTIANATAIKEDRLWDILGRAGKHVIVLGVPQTYPPPAVNGELVSCFLTPNPRTSTYTYPAALKQEIEDLAGDYQVDVDDYRTEDRDRIMQQAYDMTEQHFAVAQHLLSTRPWDFFMMVEIGLDRMHHAFWRYLDPKHPRYQPGSRFANAIRDYYHLLDDRIGETLELFEEDDTVLVVSDHGAMPMEGGICINDWLVREGYLTLAEPVQGITPSEKANIDWSRTKAWGEGGFYCRLSLNVKGREPQGIVEPAEYEVLRDELIDKLEALTDAEGRNIGTRVYRPERLYRAQNGVVPDLIVYFGNLAWRSIGTLGHEELWTFENDTGPDDANHAPDGMLIMRGPGIGAGQRHGMRLLDVAPTILQRMGLPIPADMSGTPIAE